jgi:hypothetical protein
VRKSTASRKSSTSDSGSNLRTTADWCVHAFSCGSVNEARRSDDLSTCIVLRQPPPDPYPPRAASELLPPPPAPVHHSLAGENDRLLELHRVPALIGREVEQLQQALAPYGLGIQLVPAARRRDDSRERNFPRASYDVRDVRYDPYRTAEPPRDHGRGRSPIRGGDFRDRDHSPAFRRDRSRSVDRQPPPVRRDEVVSADKSCHGSPPGRAHLFF